MPPVELLLKPRIFRFPCGIQRLILTSNVLSTFFHYRQRRDSEPEAGGLLFATFRLPSIYIVEATPPNATDKRTRVSFLPDRSRQRQMIRSRFKQGRHLVGEWHTHPCSNPTPSSIDYQSMSDSFLNSKHELDSFLMVIVGNQSTNLNLWVSAHNRLTTCQLREEPKQA